jgi:Lysozyme like domain
MTRIGDPVLPQQPIHPIAAAGHLYQAGFRYGQGIVLMLAVGWAESELGTWMRGPLDFSTNPPTLQGNFDGSVDRGWLMFNSKGHPEVTDAQADDPAQAAKAAWRVTGGGTSFGPWAAYSSGRHQQHMPAARYAVALYYYLHQDAAKRRVADIALYNWPM